MMSVENIIQVLEVKEKQALAFTKIYKDKLPYEELQKAIDEYCKSMVISFLESHKEILSDKEINLSLRRYIINIGSDKPHSGKRVFEVLYKALNQKQLNR